MTSLTDRYVHATVRELPERRRADIGAELRAAIDDQVEARVAAGEDVDAAEYAVVAEMGDPVRLAADYTGRTLALIGPRAYPTWRRLLVTLLTIVVPILTVLAGLGALIDGDSVGTVIGSVVGGAFMGAVQIAFWVTAVFAVLERAGTFEAASDGEAAELGVWTPDQLPASVEPPSVGLGETITSLVAIAVMVVLFPLQARWLQVDGVAIPVLDPDLWSSWIPLMIAALVAEAVLVIVIGRRGAVSWTLAGLYAAASAAFVVPVAVLASQGELLNPAFVAHFDWLSEHVDSVNRWIVIGAAIAWVVDVADTVVKAWRGSRRAGTTPGAGWLDRAAGVV